MSSRNIRIAKFGGRGAARACVMAGLSFALVTAPLAGCASSTTGGSASTGADASSESTASAVAVATASSESAVTLLDTSDVFSDRDWDASYDASEATTITLSDAGPTVLGA